MKNCWSIQINILVIKMPKSNSKALNFKRTLNLNSNSNQINGNIFIKRKTITLKTPKTIKVKVGKKITGKISLKKDK